MAIRAASPPSTRAWQRSRRPRASSWPSACATSRPASWWRSPPSSASSPTSSDASGHHQQGGIRHLSRCGPSTPFGTTAVQTAVATAAVAEIDLMHGAIGANLDTALLPTAAGSSCQRQIASALLKCTDTRRKEYLKCQKNGLRSGAITDAASLEATCLGTGGSGPARRQRQDRRRSAAIASPAMVAQPLRRRDLATAFPACERRYGDGAGGVPQRRVGLPALSDAERRRRPRRATATASTTATAANGTLRRRVRRRRPADGGGLRRRRPRLRRRLLQRVPRRGRLDLHRRAQRVRAELRQRRARRRRGVRRRRRRPTATAAPRPATVESRLQLHRHAQRLHAATAATASSARGETCDDGDADGRRRLLGRLPGRARLSAAAGTPSVCTFTCGNGTFQAGRDVRRRQRRRRRRLQRHLPDRAGLALHRPAEPLRARSAATACCAAARPATTATPRAATAAPSPASGRGGLRRASASRATACPSAATASCAARRPATTATRRAATAARASFCRQEAGWTCVGQPSVCILDCGDGNLDAQEECDDGDTTSGDGCSPTCHGEAGYACAGAAERLRAARAATASSMPARPATTATRSSRDGCSASCRNESGWLCTSPGTAVHAVRDLHRLAGARHLHHRGLGRRHRPLHDAAARPGGDHHQRRAGELGESDNADLLAHRAAQRGGDLQPDPCHADEHGERRRRARSHRRHQRPVGRRRRALAPERRDARQRFRPRHARAARRRAGGEPAQPGHAAAGRARCSPTSASSTSSAAGAAPKSRSRARRRPSAASGSALDSKTNVVGADIGVNNLRVDIDIDGSGLVPDCGLRLTATQMPLNGDYAMQPDASDPSQHRRQSLAARSTSASPASTTRSPTASATRRSSATSSRRSCRTSSSSPIDGIKGFLGDPDGSGPQDSPIADAHRDDARRHLDLGRRRRGPRA